LALSATLTATDVQVQNDKPRQPEAEVSCKVTAVTGACPKPTLTVNGTMVLTDGATTF